MIGHAERFKKVNTREDKIWVDQIKKERRIQKDWTDTFGDLMGTDEVKYLKKKEKEKDKKKVKKDDHKIQKVSCTSTYQLDFKGKSPLDICSKKHARSECRYKTIIMF